MGDIELWWHERTTLVKILIIFIPVIIIWIFISSLGEEKSYDTGSRSTAVSAPTSVVVNVNATATARAEEAENRRKGFHCLSLWDGNHDLFEGLIRERLNDPSSMETFETRVSPVKEGRHEILMDFGARNAFGGMVRKVAYGNYDNKTCEPELISIE